jgi:phosphoadenosine phosphosulfate reductase
MSRMIVMSALSLGSKATSDTMASLAASLAAEFAARSLFDRLAHVRTQVPGRLVFTTSFGLEDQAILHVIWSRALAIDVVTLDTGRLFPETYQLWTETEQKYGRRVQVLFPDRSRVEDWVTRYGIDGFRTSVERRWECCAIRKVEPLARALAGASGWITGLRADQSAERATMHYAELDPTHGVLKINPLFDWTRAQVAAFVQQHGIPYNTLHDRGFLSIGCAPCTRAVAPGEPERAGRWWWEQEEKKECGLHSRPQRTTAARIDTPAPAALARG